MVRIALILAFVGAPLAAQELALTPDTAAATPPESSGGRSWWSHVLAVPSDLARLFDIVHETLSTQLVERTDQLDQFFGDERIEDDPRAALIRVREEFTWAEKGETDWRTRLKVRLPLPRLERRLRLLVETDSDDEEDLAAAGEEPRLENGEAPAEDFAGLRYALAVTPFSSASLDVGGKFDDGFKARSELKLQRTWNAELWRLRLLEGIYWRDGEGWGERTRFDIDRYADRLGVLRLRSEAEWGETTRGVEIEEDLSLSRPLDAMTAVSTSVGMFLHTRPSWIIDGYSAEIRLRRQLHRKWIFFDIAPRAGFPRDRRYEFTPELLLELEIRSGGGSTGTSSPPTPDATPRSE
jgi:hypothetical protein